MDRYKERVPDVQKISSALVSKGALNSEKDIENDHIAFRTIGVPHLGIKSLESVFLSLGYTRKDPYRFEKKKVNAFWYAPPPGNYPRIFISELAVQDLSSAAQKIIRSYTDTVSEDPIKTVDLNDGASIDKFLHAPLWSLPTWEEYQTLLKESEYGAWALYNRYYLNHYTVSVHNLPDGLNTVAKFNQFLESIGVVLNDSGGKIKTSNDGLLLQSSTVAQTVEGEFRSKKGTERHRIAGSYVEFAERKILPQFANLPVEEITRRHRREGFEAQNADKIFESTYTSQINRS